MPDSSSEREQQGLAAGFSKGKQGTGEPRYYLGRRREGEGEVTSL